jgi:hypothetical protein
MSGDPKECREHAKECLKEARSAPTLLVVTRFESLASGCHTPVPRLTLCSLVTVLALMCL